ncbi:hypothetical protein IFR05_001715 [Cadophora sp. M221]|nr:hypothetical protein IFR05_001715 [Cadophora sp. M221]
MFVPYDPSAGYDPAEILPITAWNSVVDGHECTIEAMIHTAGELSEYVVRSTLLIIGIHGAVVTYDATSSESFDAVESHVLEIRDLDAERKIKYPEVVLDYPIVVAGTKVDLVGKNGRRKIAGKKLAVRLGLVGFFETSAKSGEMIEEPFTSIVRELRRRERGSSRGDTRADKSGWSTNMKAKLKRLLS